MWADYIGSRVEAGEHWGYYHYPGKSCWWLGLEAKVMGSCEIWDAPWSQDKQEGLGDGLYGVYGVKKVRNQDGTSERLSALWFFVTYFGGGVILDSLIFLILQSSNSSICIVDYLQKISWICPVLTVFPTTTQVHTMSFPSWTTSLFSCPARASSLTSLSVRESRDSTALC